MDSSDKPTFIPLPFANSAAPPYINDIPTASQIGITNGAASYTDGFPPLNFVPIASGGYPPRGADFNGLMNQISAGLRWVQAGGLSPYDATYSAAISGYPSGAVISSDFYVGLLWISTDDNNTSNPDTGGAGWKPFNRWRLTADTTFWVDEATGSDSDNGLTLGTAFATIAKASAVIEDFIDLSGFVVTVRIQPGNYSEPISMAGRLPGSNNGAASIIFRASDGPVNIDTMIGNGSVVGTEGAAFTLTGNDFTFSALDGDGTIVACIWASFATITISGDVAYSGSREANVYAGPGGIITYAAGVVETISADSPRHFWANYGLINAFSTVSVILDSTPAFSVCYANSTSLGWIQTSGYTVVSGTATGTRYVVDVNAVITTNGGGANNFPGNGAGVASNGGQYIA